MSNDLEKKKSTEISTDVTFLENVENTGREAIGAEMLSTPFVRILQSLSDQVQEGNPGYVKDAKAGMFYHTLAKETLGKELKVIVLNVKQEWLEWKPNRGGFVAKHAPHSVKVDTTDFSKWVRPDNGNNIVDTFTYFVLIADRLDLGPALFCLSTSGIRYAKSFNNTLYSKTLPNGARAPLFAGVWSLTTLFNQNEKGSWYQIGSGKSAAIVFDRFISKDEYDKYVEPSMELIKAMDVNYDSVEEATTLSVNTQY